MADPRIEINDWPNDVVAVVERVDGAIGDVITAPNATVRTGIIQLHGGESREVAHLARYLSSKLSLPDLGGIDPQSLARKIDGRLKVIGKANRRIVLVLTEPADFPRPLFNFLAILVAKTQLRLLIIGPSNETQPLEDLVKGAGLGWRSLTVPETLPETLPVPVPERAHEPTSLSLIHI